MLPTFLIPSQILLYGRRTAFEPEAKGTSGFQDFLNHLMELIHFDRINADVPILISGLLDGFPESGVDFRNTGTKKILKSNQQWEFDILLSQALHNLE